jgi:hypothetical protein
VRAGVANCNTGPFRLSTAIPPWGKEERKKKVMTNDEFLEQVSSDLTTEVQQALELLRDKGFAVAAFTPSELRGACPDHIEDAMVQMGWDAIDMNATEPRPDEEGEAA